MLRYLIGFILGGIVFMVLAHELSSIATVLLAVLAILAAMLLLGLTLVTVQTQPVWALNGSGIGQQIATAIRGVIVEIINIVTPIINILGVGMIVIGLLLGLGLRQEFLGFRLAIGGALALLTVHVIVPLLLGFV